MVYILFCYLWSMAKKIIKSAGTLPYSDAVLFDGKQIMELSGKLGIDPRTGKLAVGIEEQTAKAMEGMISTLNEAGWEIGNVVKVRVYLTDMENYAKMNEVYGRYFKKDYPARVALAVNGLPLGALVEIECVACGKTPESR
jgi:2-iminobutanoate/2-iminopropanoate deaminase